MIVAIVIVAFNRPQALGRLLASVSKADYTNYDKIPLIISVDYSGTEDCLRVANEFIWKFGDKQIINHTTTLGLKNHILMCGDLTSKYDAVVMLEDDLLVSPQFYNYSILALNFYENDENIAGISLYNNKYNECSGLPFEAVDDGFDNYFMKVPSSWGQLWTARQWLDFKKFLKSGIRFSNFSCLPENVQEWPSGSSWKKLFYNYLLQEKKYFVYPRISLTTNFGEVGQHYKTKSHILQTPLLINTKTFNFSNLKSSKSTYDVYYELEGKCIAQIINLPPTASVELDLNGTKPLNNIRSNYLISIKETSNPIKIYGTDLFPNELNILFSIPQAGDQVHYSLALTETFKDYSFSEPVIISRRYIPFKIVSSFKEDVFNSFEFKLGEKILKKTTILRALLVKIINS